MAQYSPSRKRANRLERWPELQNAVSVRVEMMLSSLIRLTAGQCANAQIASTEGKSLQAGGAMSYPIYRRPPTENLLSQGDILDPRCLQANLQGHQDYFIDDRFYRYMILTQTCDLDRTREMANFIFLAVVRRMDDVFGMWHVEHKDSTTELLNALYNHNYNKRYLFYLPTDPAHGIEQESVVDLRVMFSLHRSAYADLLKARLGALKDLYTAQLGNMAGHMFSRVATPGWQELNPGHSLKDHVKGVIASIEAREMKIFSELSATDKKCRFRDCELEAKTLRWLPHSDNDQKPCFDPYILCKTHAERIDEKKSGRESLK